MNNIIFKKIILDSFLSYDHEELDVNPVGVTFIKGENSQDSKSESNGSGKSALISESLLWCLTGYTSRGASEVKNLYLSRGASVTVELEKNGNNYVITRGTLTSSAANGLTIFKNGENVTKIKIRDTEEYFATELPELTWSVLTSIVILSQGLVGGFSIMANRDRKAKLEELSKVDMVYNDVKNIADTVETRYQSKLNTVQKSIYENSVKLSTNENMIKSLLETINNVKEKNSAVSLANDADTGIAAYEDLIKANRDEHDGIYQQIAELTKCKEDLAAEQAKLKAETNKFEQEYREFETAHNTAKQEINRLNKVAEHETHAAAGITDSECPTCHQAVQPELTASLRADHLAAAADASGQVQYYMDKATQLLNQKMAPLSLLIVVKSDDYKKAETAVHNYDNKINTLNARSRDLNYERDGLNNKVKQLLNLKAIKVESTTAYEEKVAELRIENAVLEETATQLLRTSSAIEGKLSIAKWFTSQMTKGLRSYMLSGVVEFLNTRCAEYSGYLFDTDIVSLKVDGSSLDIYLGAKQIENTSGGEHRRADIILQLAIRDLVMNEAGFTSNLLIIDEVFDHLDSLGVSTVLDLITSQKSTINSIFLITHKNDADIDYDDILVVRKENNFSRVVK